MDFLKLEKRWYSKTHRKEYVKIRFYEIFSENILSEMINGNPKAFEIAIALTKHLKTKIKNKEVSQK